MVCTIPIPDRASSGVPSHRLKNTSTPSFVSSRNCFSTFLGCTRCCFHLNPFMCGEGSYGTSLGSGMLVNTQRYMSSPFLSFHAIKSLMNIIILINLIELHVLCDVDL